MFTLGYEEMMIVAIVALIVFGPERLPEVARKLGAAMTIFKRMSNDLMREIELGAKSEGEPDKISPWPPYAPAEAKHAQSEIASEKLEPELPESSINRKS